MDRKNPLIEWYIHRFHRLVWRERCAGTIQTTKLVHHLHTMFTERLRGLVRLAIDHPPTSFNDPRNAGFLSIYTHERGEGVDGLTNVAQFRAYGRSSLSPRGQWIHRGPPSPRAACTKGRDQLQGCSMTSTEKHSTLWVKDKYFSVEDIRVLRRSKLVITITREC